jgi:hypothetical protein
MYDLTWTVNGVEREVIMWCKPIALVKWKKRVCEGTTHTMGKLVIRKNNHKQ